MITIVPYRPEWPDEFTAIGRPIREAMGALAVRIDHIGSTSVPGLAAKNIIDVQITVQDLDHPVERALKRIGYSRLEGTWEDHVPPGEPESAAQWMKWLFQPHEGARRTNVHVRVAGRRNQRYPLLFRDYLRGHAAMAEAYALVKLALARSKLDDVEAYYDVKDPVCDIIMGGAEEWAATTAWQPGPSDC